MLCISVSTVSDDIKIAYKELALIILNRIREDDITEYDYLLTNKPSLIYGGTSAFYNLMKKCKNINNITNITIDTLWTAIMITLGDERLISFHKTNHQHGLEIDAATYKLDFTNNENIIKCVASRIGKRYITQKIVEEDISNGHSICPHKIAVDIICAPNNIRCDDIPTECPICHTNLSNNSLYYIVDAVQTQMHEIEISEIAFDITLRHERIEVTT